MVAGLQHSGPVRLRDVALGEGTWRGSAPLAMVEAAAFRAMSREQLIQLIRDAEVDPRLRGDLRQAFAHGGRWPGLLQRARQRGYTVSDGDLAEARAADRAARFLQGSRMAALRPLWGSAPVLPDQASEPRRQASTAR